MSRTNRQWVLAKRPSGLVKESDFRWQEVAVPAVPDGHVLVRNLWLSFYPTQRGWMEDRPSYMPPVQIGEPMRAGAIGQVIESKDPSRKPGELVQGLFGWQDYAVAPSAMLARVPDGVEPTHLLGVLGITGLTAYFGLLDLGQPKAGDVVVVSGAAGATGSVAGQIAKLHGCHVVGIAGGPEKCAWLLREAHFDAAIDYKSENVSKRLGELCPKGIDVYFDNVGGEILDIALAQLAMHARVVICGAISQYNATEGVKGPANYLSLLVNRARMQGMVVFDYAARYGEAAREMGGWLADGRLQSREDIVEGFDTFPDALLKLFRGENTGKLLLKVD